MRKFIYSEILNEFNDYLVNNLEDTVYFESKRILDTSDDPTYIRNIISEESFELNKVLNQKNCIYFSNRIRIQRKVRDYQKYTYDLFDSINLNSELEDRLNSIQSINTIANLNKKSIFNEIRNKNKKLPISVKITTSNFEFKFDDEPEDNLLELFELIEKPEYENLFYNYNRYYFSYKNINDSIINNIKKPKKNIISFIYAILYVFLRKEEEKHKIELTLESVNKLVKNTEKLIPSEINKKYNLIDEIKFNLNESKKTEINNMR